MKLPSPAESPVEHPVRLKGVHALKAQYRGFESDLMCCEDQSTFDALMQTSRALLERIERELPDWWDGKFWNGNGYEETPNRGLADLIEAKRKELTR